MTVRLLTNIGRLWTGSEIWSNAAILTHNDRIAWVGRASELPASLPGVVEDIVDVDSVENLGGGLVTPGLIDAHTHPAIVDADIFAMAEWSPTYVAARAGRALEGMLARGFTTIRDVGAGDFGLARAVDEGFFTGPRMRFGGKQLSQTGGAGDWRAPSRRVYDDNYYAPAIG